MIYNVLAVVMMTLQREIDDSDNNGDDSIKTGMVGSEYGDLCLMVVCGALNLFS